MKIGRRHIFSSLPRKFSNTGISLEEEVIMHEVIALIFLFTHLY